MQVGDLVQLSSAGRKSQQNQCVINSWGGMIVEINPSSYASYPFKVEWYGEIKTSQMPERSSFLPMKRYEIKKMRVKK